MILSVLTGKPARLLASLEPNVIADQWLQKMGIELGDNFREIGPIQYCECRETGLRFYVPAIAAAGGDLYEQLAKHKTYYMADKWEFREVLRNLAEPSTLLEVGVGDGHFLQAAHQKGHNCHALELNAKAASRVRSLGFEVYEQSLADFARNYQKRFDVICSFQVLEHVPRPLEFLESMIALLNPGGCLILSVPNAAVMRNIDPANQDLFNQPPHHMTHWDDDVFRSLPKLLPIKVKSIRREPLAPYHIAWVIMGYLRNKISIAGRHPSRLFINRYTTLPLQLALRGGIRHFFPGHTLLVEFEHLPSI